MKLILILVSVFLLSEIAFLPMVFATDPASSDQVLSQAESLYKVKKAAEAQRLVTGFIQGNNDPKAFMKVGNLYARLKLWTEAVHYLEIAVSRSNRDALAWYELGIAQHQSKKIDAAVESLRNSIAISSKTPKSVIALGEILELTHDRYDARSVYQSALEKIGGKPEFYSRLCWLNFQDSFFQETFTTCSKAVQSNSKDFRSWTLWGVAVYRNGEHDKAYGMLQRTIKDFSSEALPYRARGLIYFQEKSYEQAVADLGKAFSLDADDDEAGIHLARSLYELQHFDQALPIFAEASRLNHAYRFEFQSKQRDLARKGKGDLAARYQLEIDKIYR